MKCIDDNLVMQYLDGELKQDQARELEKHLEACNSCRELVKEYRILYSSFSELEIVQPASDFTSAVMSELPELGYRPTKIKRYAQVCFLLLVLGFALFPYLLLVQDLGPVWDKLKILLGVMDSIFQYLLLLIEAVLIVSENLLQGLSLFVGLIPTSPWFFVTVSILILLVQTYLVKYHLLNTERRN